MTMGKVARRLQDLMPAGHVPGMPYRCVLLDCTPSIAQRSHFSAMHSGSHIQVHGCKSACGVQFDDPKDTSKDPKVVNMNIRKRVMKGASHGSSRACLAALRPS